jgi:hypothetical protein
MTQLIIRFSTLSNLKQIWMSLPVIQTKVQSNQGAVKLTTADLKSISSKCPMDMPTREQPVWIDPTTIKWGVRSNNNNKWMEIIWRLLSSLNSNSAIVLCLTNTANLTARVDTSLTSATSSSGNSPWTSTESRTTRTWHNNRTPPQALNRQLKRVGVTGLEATKQTSRRMLGESKTFLEQEMSMCLRRFLSISSYHSTKSKSLWVIILAPSTCLTNTFKTTLTETTCSSVLNP